MTLGCPRDPVTIFLRGGDVTMTSLLVLALDDHEYVSEFDEAISYGGDDRNEHDEDEEQT